MPQIIPIIISTLSTIGYTAAAIVGASVGFGTALAIGGAVIIGGAIAAKKVMGLFEVEMPKVDTDRSRQATVKSTTEPYKIIYGQTLVSGPIAFVGTANTDNKDLYYAIALAGHEVTAITDMHFDDVVIPNSEIGSGAAAGGNVGGSGIFSPKNSKTIVKINKYLGTSTQTADSDLTTAFTGWTSAHTGKGIAYIVTKWTLDEDSQETWDKYTPQNIKALVQGKKLYDPRLEYAAVSTYGQDTTNASYIAYEDNPALCLVDYLINADYGMGIAASKIDWPAVVTAANGCDVSVSVPGGSESRFTCNGVLFGTDSHRTNINKILSSMNGNLSYVNGKYVMRAGTYEAPAISLNEDDLISGLSIKTSLERGDRFNTIKGVFIDPSQNYKSTEFPEVQLADAVTRDNGEILDKEIALNMTNSSYMAQRISNKLIQLSDQQKVVTFPANLSAMRVAVGDRIQVSIDELSWSNKVFQCLGWTFSEEGGVNLTLREDSSTSYADPAVGDYSTITASGDITAGFRGIPSPSSLSATAGLKNVELDWVNPPNNKDFESIYVYASPNGNFSSAVKIGETDGTQFVHDFANGIDAVSPGDTRYYWVRAIRYVGTSTEARSNLEPNADPNTTVYATVGRVEWSDVSGSTNAPEDNATVGATLGVDLYDIDDTSVLLDSGVRNQTIVDIELEDITAGSFVIGVTYVITSIGTTDFTLIGASANTVGLVFTATGVGSGTGTASNRGIVETESNDNLSVQTVGEVGVYTYTQVTALGAQYSVKIDNNGRIAGFGLSSTLPTDTTDPAFSEFYVIADKFQIVDPASTANTPIQPFTVTAQKIRLGTDVEVSGDLVTLGTISSDRIDVSGVITAGSIITTGSTIANDIRIGSGESVFSADSNGIYLGNETFADAEFRVTPAGDLTATSVSITGTVDASTSFTFNGSNVTGTMLAANLDVSGIITAGSLITDSATINNDIRIGSGESVFSADSNGIYLGNETFADAEFRVTPAGALTATSATVTGEINATSGTISSSIAIGSGNDIFKADSNGIYLGNATFASAPFRVTQAGAITSTSGTIGGFTLGSTSLSAGSGATTVSMSTADGIHLGATAFADAPFKVSPAGALTATSATITGTVTADTFTLSSGATLTDADDKISNTNNNAFFRYETTAGGDDVSAPNNTTFNTQFGRNPRTNDVLVVVNTTSSPEVSTMYIYSGSAWVEKSEFFTGDILIDGTLTVTKLKGDVTEVYPISSTPNATLDNDSSPDATILLIFSIPAPELSLSKRNRVSLAVEFSAQQTSGSGLSTGQLEYYIERESTGFETTEIGTCTYEYTVVTNYVEVISFSGNVTHLMDSNGAIAPNTSPTSSQIGNIISLYYIDSSNKTFVEVSYGSGTSPHLSTGDTIYFSPSRFTTSGTYTKGIWSGRQTLVMTGSSINYFTVPLISSFGNTTTARNYRISAKLSAQIASTTIKCPKIYGTVENIS